MSWRLFFQLQKLVTISWTCRMRYDNSCGLWANHPLFGVLNGMQYQVTPGDVQCPLYALHTLKAVDNMWWWIDDHVRFRSIVENPVPFVPLKLNGCRWIRQARTTQPKQSKSFSANFLLTSNQLICKHLAIAKSTDFTFARFVTSNLSICFRSFDDGECCLLLSHESPTPIIFPSSPLTLCCFAVRNVFDWTVWH